MASSSSFSSLLPQTFNFKQFPSNPSSQNLTFHPIKLSLSEKPPASSVPTQSSELKNLPIRKIPGDYGIPLISPWIDRQDYFYNQGRDEYFKSRIQKYQSTVFKTNMPPGPFISFNSNVIVLLDGKSFPTLFDLSKVEKKDLFTGTFMPSTELTGGYRVLSYLDPSEPNHPKLKQLLFFLLSSRRDYIIPEFHTSYVQLFETLEINLQKDGKVELNSANDQAAFNFLARSLFGVNPLDTKLGSDGPKLIGKWVAFQLHPLLTIGLPKVLEDIILHTFRLPSALVKKDYQTLYSLFSTYNSAWLDEAEKLGISSEEACHNILFATCFNSFGGMKILFPNMLKWIGKSGSELHTRLVNEIRPVVKRFGGKITMAAMEKMPLMKSVVYEALRIEPPVASQYGRAKNDILIESHDAVFEVKRGELLFGYQPFATKDPRIFTRPEEFVADRFVGEAGEKLLKHVLWSNGPETENPTVENKQCAGKDFVVLVARLLVTEFFLRYDTFEVNVGTSPLGALVTITSLKKASF